MSNKIVWKGLRVEEFIHPQEQEAKEAAKNSSALKKAMSLMSDVSMKLNHVVIEGTYIQLSEKVAPHVMEILRDVCRILDYDKIPDVYVNENYGQTVQPCYCEREFLIVSNWVLTEYDDEMLYYLFGNAIAMLLAGHVEMTTAAAYMGCNLLTMIPQIEFKRYLHLADATSDRGGLLACQSIAAAARCHFCELGMPVSYTKKLLDSDESAERYIEQYLLAVQLNNQKMNFVNIVAEKWMNAVYMEGAANHMLADLYQWYRTGYQTMRKRYLNMD